MQSSGVYFSNLRLRLQSISNAKGTWGFVLVIVVIQACITMLGGYENFLNLYAQLGLTRTGVSEGKIWQLASYGLLHGGFLHTLVNVFCLLMLGSRIEHFLGPRQLLKTLFAGIIGGGIAHLLLDSSEAILVGASGGCVALLILLTTVSPDSRMWPLPLSGRSLGIAVMAAELLMALIDPRLGVPGFSRIGFEMIRYDVAGWFEVGHACHFGGGLAGFLYGCWLLRPRVTATRLRRERERREARKAVPNS